MAAVALVRRREALMEQTVLVTGGTGGLGVAVTRAFLDTGWRVVVPWIVERERERMPAEHPGLTLVQADLFDADAVGRCVAAAADSTAPLRAVVNLVGGFDMGGLVHETPVDRFENQLRLNLRATYLTCHAALPHLMRGGGGSIVCMSSGAARRPFPGAAGYIVAKAGVLGLVDALAVEYAKHGIRVNALLPGVIDTPANRAAMPDADRAGWVAPEVIARSVLFLCSPESAATTGAHLPVDRA